MPAKKAKKKSSKAPSPAQLKARAKFAAAAKARSKKAGKKKVSKKPKRQNKTIITKPKKVIVINKLNSLTKKNPYQDLVIKGFATKTPQGWKIGKKTIPQGKGTVAVSSGYKLDRATGAVYAKRARSVAQGFFDGSGVFHPIRSSSDYNATTAGETGKKPIHTRSKKRKAATKKAGQTARHKAETRKRKSTASRLASRSLQRSVPLKRAKRNPSVKEIRKTFAGSLGKAQDVFAPVGTPKNVAKLGKLVFIDCENATVTPRGTVYLCADTKGKFHLCGSKDAPIWSGPAENFGQVKKIKYEESKPHLYPGQGIIEFWHRMGEENGKRPVLLADGKGGLKFRGGDYKITREGIVN